MPILTDLVPDPLADLRGRLDVASRIGLGGGSPRAEYRTPFSPRENESFLRQAADYGKSGVGYAFGTLNKGGRAVRGLLAGDLDEAQAILPFSDSIGWTDPRNEWTGRRLLNQWGVTDRNDRGWGAWTAGLATDILTDPLTYASFGAKTALTPAGKALSRTGALRGWSRSSLLQGFEHTEPALLAAGKTADEIAHMGRQGARIASQDMASAVKAATGRELQAGERLSGLLGFGLPFRGPAVTLGGGALGRGIGRGLDALGHKVAYSPVGVAASALFDSRVKGAADALTQKAYRAAGTPLYETLMRDARDLKFGLTERLEPHLRTPGVAEGDVLDAARAGAIGVPATGVDPALATQVQAGVGSLVSDAGKAMLEAARRKGLPLQSWRSKWGDLNYVHRSASAEALGSAASEASTAFPLVSGSNFAREPVFDVPGADLRLNDWARRFAGHGESHRRVGRLMFQDMMRDYQGLQGLGTANLPVLTKDLQRAMYDQAVALSKRYAGLNPRHVAGDAAAGIRPHGLFTQDLVGDLFQRAKQHARTMAGAEAALESITEASSRTAGMLPGTFVTAPELARRLGLETYKSSTPGISGEIHGALAELGLRLARKGAPDVKPMLGGKVDDLTKAVSEFGVPLDRARAILRDYATWSAPEVARAPLRFWDSSNNLFKALTYPIWVASHVRNATTAAVNNLRTCTTIGDYLKELALMRRAGWDGAAANAERASRFANAGIYTGHNAITDTLGRTSFARFHAGERMTEHLPGTDRAGPTGWLLGDVGHLVLKEGLYDTARNTSRALAGIARHPFSWSSIKRSLGENLGVAGVGQVAHDTLPAIHAGRKASTNIEDFFRGAQYRGLLRQGYAPEEAGRLVNAIHFDYGALTDFERRFMRRIVPFYTFARKNLPLQLKTLATRPGISMAQFDPAMQGREHHPYVPDYLQARLAVPIGRSGDGFSRYIGSFGLPVEEALGRFKFQGPAPSASATLMSFMGQMNPLLKWPIEQTFDTQLYSGRKLSDLRAPATARGIGALFHEDNPQALSQFLVNTPLTRFVTAVDEARDARKPLWARALNLGTGVKITDVDEAKQRAIEARDYIQDQLRARPAIASYMNFYPRPGYAPGLSPEEAELLRAWSTYQKNARLAVVQERARQASGGRIGVNPR